MNKAGWLGYSMYIAIYVCMYLISSKENKNVKLDKTVSKTLLHDKKVPNFSN